MFAIPVLNEIIISLDQLSVVSVARLSAVCVCLCLGECFHQFEFRASVEAERICLAKCLW